MKFFRHYLEIALALCVLALFIGCASPLQKADKLAMSDPKSAITVYEQVMAAKPGSEEARQAHLGIAKTYYERIEDQEKGLAAYEEVIEKYPKTPEAGKAQYAVAWHYMNAKNYETAREKFAIVTKEMPGTDEASAAALAIAKCYEELKKFDEAANLYKEFSASHPSHKYAAQAELGAARSYERAGKTDEAIDVYKNVASKYSFASSGREAKDSLTNLGVDVSEIEAQVLEAETPAPAESQPQQMANIGGRRRTRARNVPRPDIGSRPRPGQEEAQARKTVSPDFGVDPADIMPPGITGGDQGTIYDAMYMMANMSLQSREYKNAGALYEKSLQLAGKNTWKNAASAYFGLAKSYRGIGMPDKAAEMFREAIKRDRKIIDRMIVTGETAYGDDEYDEALAAYNTALGLAPHKDAEIYYNIGLVYQKLKDNEKELESFERSVALKPNFTDAVQHLAEVLYYRTKDAIRADLYDKEVRGQGNTDYRIQAELGNLCYRYGIIFSKEAERDKQSSSCYSWSKIKYGNAVRMLKKNIDSQLKKIVSEGDETEAKQIAPAGEKITIELVSTAAASGNPLAVDAMQRSALLMTEYRFMNSRIVICNARMGREKDAQKKADEFKAADPGIIGTAEFNFALGELALAQGNKEAAIAGLKKALEINPELKEVAERLAEIEGQEAAPSEDAG